MYNLEGHHGATTHNATWDCVITCLKGKVVILATHQVEVLSLVDNILDLMREEMYKINAEMRNVATVESHDDDGKIKLISIRLYDIALMWHRQFMRIVGENVTYSMYNRPEEQSMSFFITGLQSDIKLAVRMFKPKSLAKLYGLCKVQESQLNVTKQRGKIPLLATPMYTYSSPNVINSPKLLALSAPKANWRNKPSTSASNTYRKQLT
ncbi:hypothetical protein Tco_0666956 [Tanacetum coccineum]